jgi:hypothetical protein
MSDRPSLSIAGKRVLLMKENLPQMQEEGKFRVKQCGETNRRHANAHDGGMLRMPWESALQSQQRMDLKSPASVY